MGIEPKNGGFQLRRVMVTEHGCTYPTFQVVGYLSGARVRKRFPRSAVHEIPAASIAERMQAKPWAPKTWNNVRGSFSAFFDFCAHDFRRWATVNPMALIEPRKVARGLPHIETAEKIGELFAFLETFTGGPRQPHPPGFLVPYFALATFAGLRPAVPGGEIWKIGKLKEPARVIDSAIGVIRIPPEIAKTDSVHVGGRNGDLLEYSS